MKKTKWVCRIFAAMLCASMAFVNPASVSAGMRKGLMLDDYNPPTSQPEDEQENEDDTNFGITSGNYCNNGFFAFDGDVCYFVWEWDLYKGSPDNLEEAVLICEDVDGDLNIIGEHCVYRSGNKICACCLDGSGSTVLFETDGGDNALESLYMEGEWAYFTTAADELYRFSIMDLSSAEFVAEDVYMQGLCFLNGKLYYCSEEGIIRMNPDGTGKELFSDKRGTIFTDGRYIYCDYTGKMILCFDEDGREETIFWINDSDDAEDIRIASVNYNDGWIYIGLTPEDGSIHLARVRADGSEHEYLQCIYEYDAALISMCTQTGTDYVLFFIIEEDENSYNSIIRSFCFA